MGCDFDLFLQVLRQGRWETFFHAQTKTRCGGYPICSAARRVAKACPGTGTYHAKEPVLFMGEEQDLQEVIEEYESEAMWCEDSLAATGTKKAGSEVRKPSEALRELRRCARQLEELSSGLALTAYVCDRSCFFFSVGEFEEYLGVLRDLEAEGKDKEEYECNRMLYTRCLQDVPTWTRMLSTAGSAVEKRFWLDERPAGRQEVREAIERKQHEGAEQWTTELGFILKAWRLPADVLQLLAKFSLPAAEVRVALRDDEGQMEAMRQGDLEQPQCTLM